MTRLRIELEVSRTDGEPRCVALSAPDDVAAGAALDLLGAHVGLDGAAGAVQARSLVSGRWVDRSTRLRDTGLLRGERLAIGVGLAPGGRPARLTRWPDLRNGDDEGRVAVNRPPRSVRAEPEATLPMPSKRRTRSPRRFPLGAMMIPLLIGILLVAVTKRWEIALFSLFTPVMVGWNFVEERRARSDELKEYGRTYDEEVALTTDRIRALTADWADWLRRHHPSPDEVVEIARDLTPRLWERQPGDPDHLRVRVGRASRRGPVTLRADDYTFSDGPAEKADYEAAALVDDAPVVVDLGTDGLLAVLGSGDDIDRVGAWLAAQLATLHSPADLVMAGALADADTGDWWRWLPHLAHGRLRAPALARDTRAADELLEAVTELAQERRLARESRARGPMPALVVFVDDRLAPDPALLRAVADCRDVGVLTVWLGEDSRSVPTAAPQLLTLDAGSRSAELVGHRGGERVRLVPESLGRSAVLDLSSSLAPVRDAADAFQVRSVPDRVSLEELVPDLASPVGVRRRWENASLDTLVARLGRSDRGEVTVDLGPSGSHALVGGTTGSGKSELLQTMVASLAAEYPPDRVGFLLVDYKGGAAFKDAMRLPHCVGVVTDLDEHLTRRVLQALDAEIRRREELLSDAGARDLTELRHSAPESAPGDLVIVVDEFATLAKEIPEFVEGVVDIAARGRSLGLRLVLATQRPAGVINDRIRANVGVRIALRVNDESDSNDVIESREAAHIPRTLPGRAFLKVHRDLEEFQSAFVGGPVRDDAAAAIEVDDLWSAAATAPRWSGASETTLLEAVVSACDKVMRLGRWATPHVPWLPAMPPMVTLGELSEKAGRLRAGSVPLALADLPQQQAQRVVALDLEQHQNLLVFGTSRSGKTTVLRTIAAGLMASLGPDELHLYGLDFGGHGLHVLTGAAQCCGVVGPDEPGRIARLLRRVGSVVDTRKRAMATAGVTDFSELARRTIGPMPRLVVLLDGYAGATAALERLDGGRLLERLERLIPDGPSVGVHFVITADRRAAVPSALTSVITTRLVLRMAERDDYTLLGVESALARHARLGPGRGFIQGSTEVQVGVLASADATQEHAALAQLGERTVQHWPVPAPPLGRMPGEVLLESLPTAEHGFVLPCGIGDADVAPVHADLSAGHLLVVGPPRSGRTSALMTLAAAAQQSAEPPALALVLARRTETIDPGKWDVGPIDGHDQVALSRGLDEVGALLAQGRPVILLCDDVDALPDSASQQLEEVARAGRDQLLRIVAAADNRWALRAYGGLVPELRKAKQAILLTPDVELDGDLVGTRLRPPLEPLGAPGRGFLVQRGVAELVQLARIGGTAA